MKSRFLVTDFYIVKKQDEFTIKELIESGVYKLCESVGL